VFTKGFVGNEPLAWIVWASSARLDEDDQSLMALFSCLEIEMIKGEDDGKKEEHATYLLLRSKGSSNLISL